MYIMYMFLKKNMTGGEVLKASIKQFVLSDKMVLVAFACAD